MEIDLKLENDEEIQAFISILDKAIKGSGLEDQTTTTNALRFKERIDKLAEINKQTNG